MIAWKEGTSSAPTFAPTYTAIIKGRRVTVFQTGRHAGGEYHLSGRWKWVRGGVYCPDEKDFEDAEAAKKFCEETF